MNKNPTLTKNMPHVKWKEIPPVKGPNPQGLIDKGVISNKVKLKDLKDLANSISTYSAKRDIGKILKK
jgi:hypothetical protein|tara:strand:+ start:521 stop:724 length:204 start_codon:yes stop_codon:yes gene_type:complete